jgi:hypothetical protein
MVVDEGVLSLMNYETPDPLAFFHHEREPGVSLFDLRQYLLARSEDDVLPRPARKRAAQQERQGAPLEGCGAGRRRRRTGGLGLVGTGRGGGGARPRRAWSPRAGRNAGPDGRRPRPSAGEGRQEGQPGARRGETTRRPRCSTSRGDEPADLAALAVRDHGVLQPEVIVGETGLATIEIPMPENLTTFRVMAVAVDPDRPDHFGSADVQVKVRKPIMLRPSLPRFANFGDSFQASVMVDNQTDVAAGDRRRHPRHQRADHRRDPEAGRDPRRPVAGGPLPDGRRPGRHHAPAVRGAQQRRTRRDRGLAAGAVPGDPPGLRRLRRHHTSVLRALKVPEGMLPGFGGLELSMSSTALNGLEDAVEWLIELPVRVHRAGRPRMLPIFVLGPVLEQFPIASVKDLAKRQILAADGIARLASRQNYDGGFRYWDTPERSWPYLSTWATFALLEGKKAGFKVDQAVLDKAMNYLENFVRTASRPRGAATTTTPAGPSRCGCCPARTAAASCSTPCTPGATRSRSTPAPS